MSTYTRNQPGVLFLDTINRLNPVSYCQYISCTNPCLAGDTLIAVADGRNGVSIKQLSDIGEPFDVYTIKDGKTTISKATKVFKTKDNAKIIKITLDDGSSFKCTPDHKILLRNETYKQAKDLIAGQSIMPFNSYLSNNRYRQISSNTSRDRRQYRMIADYYGIIVNGKQQAIHHINYNSLDDNINNLIAMSRKQHMELHRKNMLGDKNPMRR